MGRKKYTLEQKQNALQLYKNGKSAYKIAQETGISVASIYNWARKKGIRKNIKSIFVNQKLNHKHIHNILPEAFWEQTEPLNLSLVPNEKQIKNDFDILEEDIFRPSIITPENEFNNLINVSKDKIIKSQEIIMLNDNSDSESLVIDEDCVEPDICRDWDEVEVKQNISEIEKFLNLKLQEGTAKIVI